MNRRDTRSRIYRGLPPSSRALRVGLYGGSFNPAHLGHRQVSLVALRQLGLDRIWWLVSPGNPLKSAADLAPLADRLRRAALIADHPRIDVTGVEAEWRVRYTSVFLGRLLARRPQARFVWLMGTDALAELHRWRAWRTIVEAVPLAIMSRPESLLAPFHAPAAYWMRDARHEPADLLHAAPPAFTVLSGPRRRDSSTALRGSP